MQMENKDPIQKKEINIENLKNLEKYPKFLEKSDQFYFETLSKNEKLTFIISFALIEDKNLVQKIIVSVKPYAMKNKTNLDDKENYIEEIKKALSRVSYREKFSMQDFRDISDIYANDQNLNMKKIFGDLVQSTKEKKARIKINKYHMIFNYYINNDNSDLNNSIMLCLDNEIESSILEKYYENTFRKLFKAKYNNENIDNNKIELIENKTNNDSAHNNNENINNNNNSENNENKIIISPLILNNDNCDENKKEKEKEKEKEVILDSKIDSKNENLINIEKPLEKRKIFEIITENNNIDNGINNSNSNKSSSSSNSKKEKTKKRSRKQILSNENEEKEKEINDKKEGKKTITKNFLYNEYNISKNKSEKKIIEDSDEDESWGESLFFDKDEIKPSEENKNLLGNKKSRAKTPREKKAGKKSVIKISKLDIDKKEAKEEKNKTEGKIIILDEDEEEMNKKNKTTNKKINNENINNDNESIKNKKIILDDNNINTNIFNKIINPSKNPLYQKNISILQKYMPKLSSIINSPLEIFILKEKIEPYNKIFFKLVYSSQDSNDDYDTFKSAVIDNYRNLILIKTEKNVRFAIYLNEKLFSSNDKQGQDIIDMMAFIYSFEKKTFFVPSERMVCFTQSPPKPFLFKLSENSIYIKNNFRSEKHYLSEKNKVFKIDNLFKELNNGGKEFNIAVLEVYRVEISQ